MLPMDDQRDPSGAQRPGGQGQITASKGPANSRRANIDVMASLIRHPLAIFVLCLGTTLLFRWPYFFSEELGWDEILYSLIAKDMLDGVPPYAGLWDRKPIGIFLILGGFHAIFGESVLALRLAAATGIALTATGLILLSRHWFPTSATVGVTAALLSIVYTLNAGGSGTNTELWFSPCVCWAALCLTKALKSEGRSEIVFFSLAFQLLESGP